MESLIELIEGPGPCISGKRSWLKLGVSYEVLPGVLFSLQMDRQGELYQGAVYTVATASGSDQGLVTSYDIIPLQPLASSFVFIRAVERNQHGLITRVLVEAVVVPQLSIGFLRRH